MNQISLFSNKKKALLLIIPIFLLLSTYFVFGFLAEVFGEIRGYLGGFLFYWIFWCFIIPVLLIGLKSIKALFKDPKNRLGKPKLVGIVFLLGPVVSPFLVMFLPIIGQANMSILLISAIFALTNGTLEELLWRGVFTSLFPNSWIWSYLYPSIMFGYWHLSPQVVFPSQMPGGVFAFATMSIFMGLTFGWIVKKTHSIRYTVIAHILTDFMGLAGFAFIIGSF